jgi:hypothetical protein
MVASNRSSCNTRHHSLRDARGERRQCLYKRFPDLEIEHPSGSVTKYNLEISWPEDGKIEVIVVSESPNNQGPPARSCERDIGEQIAAQTGQQLKDVRMFVEQADGKYFYRTFREYQAGPAPEHPGEERRITVDANYEDRRGDPFTRQEVDKYMAQSEIPHERRLVLDNAQQYDLSQEYFSGQNRPPEPPPQSHEQSQTISPER